MKVISILTFFLILMMPDGHLQAHGYLFSMVNEEMRDKVNIEINQNFFLIRYASLYQGQIAPHLRLMIDRDGDEQITRQEVDDFIGFYKKTLNDASENRAILINGSQATLSLVTAFGPTLTTDSLLAPFYIELLFSAAGMELQQGENELVIDPRVLFESGTHFLRMARDKVEFTDEQEEAIGRFLQLDVIGDSTIRFISTYPGRLKNSQKMAQIYGVFFDKTPLEMKEGEYPLIRIKFNVM